MQLYQAETDTKYRVFFNELETNNLEKIMGDDISIRNVQLCAYLEDTLPKAFSECIGKMFISRKQHNFNWNSIYNKYQEYFTKSKFYW